VSAPGLREEARADALWWTLDNPRRRNAVGPDALRWIARRCAALRGETVVLTGAGEQAFCAGFDLTALEPTADGPSPDAPLAEAAAAMEQADATFVAAINGFAIGAGLELACACDLRIAHEATWFAIPAAKLGVVYHAQGIVRLRTVLGDAILKRLLLLGERVQADALADAGALTHLVAPASLPAAIEACVDALAAGARHTQHPHRDLLRALGGGDLRPETLARHEQARREAYGRLRVAKSGGKG